MNTPTESPLAGTDAIRGGVEVAIRRILADEVFIDVVAQAIAHRVGLIPTARQTAQEILTQLRERL